MTDNDSHSSKFMALHITPSLLTVVRDTFIHTSCFLCTKCFNDCCVFERILILLCSNVLHLVILFVNYMYFFFVHLFFFKLSPYFVYRGWVHLLRFSIKFHLFQSSREKTIFLKSILATFLHCKFKTRGSKKNIPNVFNHLSMKM